MTAVIINSPFVRRTRVLTAVFVLGFAAVVARLGQLQILHADHYRRAERDRLDKLVQMPPARGELRDRNGKLLAQDRPSFDLWLAPAREERKRGSREVVGHLGELDPVRLVQIARSHGAQRDLEESLALRYLAEKDRLAARLAEVLGRSREEVARTLLTSATGRLANSPQALCRARPCFRQVGREAYVLIEQSRADPNAPFGFEAMVPRIGSRRVFPAGETMGHITGTVGRLTREEYDILRGYWVDGEFRPGQGRIDDFFVVAPESAEAAILRWRPVRRRGETVYVAGYLYNEMVGRAGVEQYYNQRLRGAHALRLLRLERPDPEGPRRFVDASDEEARDGLDTVLTIDLDLQKRVQAILQKHLKQLRRDDPQHRSNEGIVVLLDPRNGRIHAMVSEPGYDPNTFRRDYADLLKDSRLPLINKAIAGQYPPGSVMKPLVALAGLQEREIAHDTIFRCNGAIQLGDKEYIEMRRAFHGDLSVVEALEVSSNIFFYLTGERLGGPKLYRWAWDLGLGHPTGIDIAGEQSGHLPLKAKTGRGWALGNTYHLSIGQGPITVTPLQMAVAYAAIANGGKVVRPHVRYDPRDPALDEPRRVLQVDPAALEVVRQGMWRVVQGSRGTAHKTAAIEGLEFAGKTGSAEWKKRARTHAWFAGFAPFDNPEVVIVVLVPRGNFGGSTCGPIAHDVLKAFFGIEEREVPPGEAPRG